LKIKHLAIAFLFFSLLANSQTIEDLEQQVSTYPKTLNTIEDIAYRIHNDFNSKELQARAVYTWISKNIAYDLSRYYSFRSPPLMIYRSSKEQARQMRNLERQRITKTLESKKGICGDYASLFVALCEKLEIPAKKIRGYTKLNPNFIGADPGMKDHLWNAVYLDEEWHLVDTTWGAGYEVEYKTKWEFNFSNKFYKAPPEVFIQHHYPGNPTWQLLEKPISKETFFSKPVFYTYYSSSDIHLADDHEGILTEYKNDTYLIYFDKLPKGKEIYYQNASFKFAKKLFIHRKNNKLVAKVKVKNPGQPFLTLFTDNKAIVNFKLERASQ